MKNKSFLFVVLLLLNTNTNGYGLSFTYINLDRIERPYTNFSGKPLLVDTFATWCLPCVTEVAHLKQVNDAIGNNASILSLSIEPGDTVTEVKLFRDNNGGSWEFGLDKDLEFLSRYNPPRIPSLYLFDSTGEMVFAWYGLTGAGVIIDKMNELFGYEFELNSDANSDLDILIDQITSSVLIRAFGVIVLISLVYLVLNPSGWKRWFNKSNVDRSISD